MATQTILDEELTTDSDFGDLFPPKEITTSDLDEIKTVIDEGGSPTTEKKDEPVQKKRVGRPPKKAAEASDVTDNQPKKKPGRPPKKAAPEGETKSVEKPAPKEEASSTVEKKPRAKRVSVDDLPPETIECIYEGYSTKPIEELSSEVNLSDKHIQKLMDRLKEIFELEISSGGLTQEDFDKDIAPKFVPFTPKDPLASFVKKKIKNINK